MKDWGLLGPEGELLGVALDRTVPFRDSANLTSHMVIQRPFFSLPGVQKNTSQLPSVDKPFSHVLLHKTEVLSGRQTMKGLVSHLRELGFSLQGSGGFLTRSGMI